jgi:hypothetical protein
MSKIIKLNFLLCSISESEIKKFNENLNDVINTAQDQDNLEVEVQYQQNNNYCSVLILGREKEKV